MTIDLFDSNWSDLASLTWLYLNSHRYSHQLGMLSLVLIADLTNHFTPAEWNLSQTTRCAMKPHGRTLLLYLDYFVFPAQIFHHFNLHQLAGGLNLCILNSLMVIGYQSPIQVKNHHLSARFQIWGSVGYRNQGSPGLNGLATTRSGY